MSVRKCGGEWAPCSGDVMSRQTALLWGIWAVKNKNRPTPVHPYNLAVMCCYCLVFGEGCMVCVTTGVCCSCVCHLNCQWHWRRPILKSLCNIILLTSGQQLFFSSLCGNPNLLYTKCLLLQVLMLGNENMHIQLCVLLEGGKWFFFLFFFLSPVF